jgi:hypothetical protein
MAAFIPEGCDHEGIIGIDGRTIAQRDISVLVKALSWLRDSELNPDWKNRTGYLRLVRY